MPHQRRRIQQLTINPARTLHTNILPAEPTLDQDNTVIQQTPSPVASPPVAVSSSASTAHTRSTAATAKKSTAAADDWNRCGQNRDIIVRYITPTLPPAAQVLGAYNLGTCQSTLDSLRHTSPTDAGNCTQAAWASDNPGYNADATPAKPLRKVVEAIGPAC
jgi:hypothetical protein